MFDNAENQQRRSKTPTIEELYSELTTEEQAEAETTLRRYIELVWRIYQRRRSEEKEKFDES